MEYKRPKRKRLGAILVISFSLLLIATACTTAPTTQSQEKVVKVGSLTTHTGPGGAACQYAFMTWAEYMKYVNDENLIPGVTVENVWADTRQDTGLAISSTRRFIDMGTPVIMSIVYPDYLRKILAQEEVPLLSLAVTSAAIYPPGWIYHVYPTWPESFAAWCQWIMSNWEEDRPPRVTLIGPDSPLGPPAIESALNYVESIGIEMLPSEFIPYVPLDTSPQLLRMNERGSDFVYICGIWTLAVPVLKDAERLGLIGKMHFAGYDNTQSTGFLKALGTTAEGYTSPRTIPWVTETEIPGIELMRELRTKYNGKLEFQSDEAHSIVIGAVLVEALNKAIEDVGYENLNGAAVKRALGSINNFDAYGIKTITYTPEDHRGNNLVKIYQVIDGNVVPISDYIEAPMLAPEE